MKGSNNMELYKYLKTLPSPISKENIHYTNIAKELGTTRQTISKQFQKLLDSHRILYNPYLQSYEINDPIEQPPVTAIELLMSNLQFLAMMGVLTYKDNYPEIIIHIGGETNEKEI